MLALKPAWPRSAHVTRRIIAISFICVSIIGIHLANTPDVSAGSDELAKIHFKAGQAYYRQGNYDVAIREFKQAYDLTKKPALLYNIAQAYERLGNIGQAIEHYRHYVKDSGNKDTATIQKIKNLEQRLQKTGIRISSSVSGATILIDGKNRGTTPQSTAIAVTPGNHQIRVVKEGFMPFSAVLVVPAGSVVAVTASLEAKPTPAPVPQPTAKPLPTPKPVEKPKPVAHSVKQPVKPIATPHPRKRLWTWIALGTGGALLVTGAITGGLALSAADSAQTDSDDDASQAKTLGAVTDVLLIAGGAAVVTGVVLFFLEGKSDERRAMIAPAVTPTFAGASASFRF